MLRYAPDLAAAVDGRRQLAAGGQAEVEIRAATVAAVEQVRPPARPALRALGPQRRGSRAARWPADPQAPCAALQLKGAVRAQLAAQGRGDEAAQLNSVLLDWTLWEEGERSRSRHRPHHRVLTVYY